MTATIPEVTSFFLPLRRHVADVHDGLRLGRGGRPVPDLTMREEPPVDPAITFYQTLAGTSFTLLGLWFGVLQFAHGGWRTDPGRHRWSTHIALHFFLPGMASLASMLAAGTGGLIWRITFVAVGLAGLVEAVSFLRTPVVPRPRLSRMLCALDPVLYASMLAVAIVPKGAFSLPPLQLAGMATGSVFLVGLCHIWLAFTERREEDRVMS